MADTYTYISKQKVEKWTTKERFNALELATIETGTEYNLTGTIDEGELDSALQAKINEISGKLTKPTNPSAESAVTMLADGTVGTKPLSEIGGGGKLYRHKLYLVTDTNSYSIYFPSSNSTQITTTDLIIENKLLIEGSTAINHRSMYTGVCIKFSDISLYIHENGHEVDIILDNISTIRDSVTEL